MTLAATSTTPTSVLTDLMAGARVRVLSTARRLLGTDRHGARG